jgi:diguanylate cyclase (GGDEF)-like protein
MKVSSSIPPFNNEIDLSEAVEIAPRIWWVGHHLENDPFQCHVYLIENGDQSILIDPGSKLTWPYSREKIRRIIPLENIKYIVCQHPDPDITSGIEDLLAEIGTEGRLLVTHWRSAKLLEHYDWGIDFYEVQAENWELVAGDRRIEFIFTPYMHFPGAICTYDIQTEILFSSDIFGAITKNFSLFATDEKAYFEAMIPFHTHYMPATEIVNHGLDNIEKYPLSLIAPQHGSIIKKAFIPYLIKELRNLKCGIYLEYGGTRKIELISKINAIMPEVFEAAAFFDSFHRDTQHILKIIQKVFPVSRILALVLIDNSYFIKLDSDNDTVVPCSRRKEDILDKFSEVFFKQKRLVMESEMVECIRFKTPGKLYLFPIRSYDKKATGIGMFALDPTFETSEEILNMLRKFEIAVDVIAKREVEVYRLENEKREVYTMAITDQLTGLYNRHYLEETGEKTLAKAKRHNYPIAVLCLDIDYFKKINDRYGHDIGDKILKHFATLISEHLRKSDLAFRLGGEEFMVLMPYTNRLNASKIAKRLQTIVKERGHIDTTGGKISFTFSGGVTDTEECGYDLQNMLKRADEKLYAAKAAGRNRIIV